MGTPRTFAIVPACGQSKRMGEPKLALPFRDRTVIEHVVSALRQGGATTVLVVVGPHLQQLVPLARVAGADVLQLDEPTRDMRSTVELGLQSLEERYHPTAADWWLLAPADHPVLTAAVVEQLICAAYGSPDHTIVVPVHNERRGHPTLARWGLAGLVRTIPSGRGINWLFREHVGGTREVAVGDASVLCDLDTPEDYLRLLRDLP